MISGETIFWVALILWVVFLLHSFIFTPRKLQDDDGITIDARLLGEDDRDLTDPKQIALLVYRSIAVDLKSRVSSLETEVEKLVHFRTVFGFYAAVIGMAMGVLSLYMRLVGG